MVNPVSNQLKGNRRADYAGILPKKGWPKRNYHFLRHRLLPQVFHKRDGTQRDPIPHAPDEGKIRVTWIGHASFLIQFPDHSVIIDPNWANWHGVVKRKREPGLGLQLMPLVDLVMVTHAHFDHLHKKSLKILESHEGIVVPNGSGKLVRRLGFNKVHEMSVWDKLNFENLQITHTPSHHWGARYLHDTHATTAAIWFNPVSVRYSTAATALILMVLKRLVSTTHRMWHSCPLVLMMPPAVETCT